MELSSILMIILAIGLISLAIKFIKGILKTLLVLAGIGLIIAIFIL